MENRDFIRGTIVEGLGEGSIFMSMEHYKDELKKNLGFEPFPGTLNIKLESQNNIKFKNKIRINGFEKAGKKFYGATLYRAKIGNVDGAIIVPDINKHKENILEFIAPVKIKDELDVRNGDRIKIELL